LSFPLKYGGGAGGGWSDAFITQKFFKKILKKLKNFKKKIFIVKNTGRKAVSIVYLKYSNKYS
jgi:hypothetical protein